MANGTLTEEVKRRKAADALLADEDATDAEAEDTSSDQSVSTDLESDTDTSQEKADTTEGGAVVQAEKRFNPNAQSLSDYFGKPSAPTQQTYGALGSEEGLNVPPDAFDSRTSTELGRTSSGREAAAPTQQIYSGPEEQGGQRYVIDADTGQKVPYAEPATAADKAAQPPEGHVLRKIDVAVDPEVRRAELIDPDPDRQYLAGVTPARAQGVPAPDKLTQIERGELVKPPQPVTQGDVRLPAPGEPAAVQMPVRKGVPGQEAVQMPVRTEPVGPPTVKPAEPGVAVTPTAPAAKLVRGPNDQSLDDYFGPKKPPPTEPQPIAQPEEKPAAPFPVPTAEYTDRVQKWRAAMQAYGFDAKVKPDGTWVGTGPDGKEVTPEQNKGLYQFGARLSQQYGFSGQEQKLGQLGDVPSTAPAVKPAEAIPAPPKPSTRAQAESVQPAQPITTNPNGTDLPQRVQAVGNNDPAAFIVHHTSGRGTVDGVVSTLKERGLGVQYVMDRDGNIFQTGGPGAQNILTGWGKGAGLSNQNVVGMEIIAKDDKDVTPAQAQAYARFMAARYPNTPIYGHGEVNPGHKEADEGQSAKAAALAYRENQAGVAAQAPGAAPQAQPVTKGANGLYQNEKPQDFLTGKTTTFATPDDIASGQDNGVGADHLGKLDTTSVAGVAIPEEALRAKYGNNYAAWRRARVDIVDQSTGKRLRVPIADLGPRGDLSAIADMTPFVSNYFGGDKNLSVKLVDNAGPDAIKNPQLFADEQAAIKQGFDSSSVQPGVQKIQGKTNYQLVPQNPEQAAQAQKTLQTAIRQQHDIISKLPEADSGNVIGLYKRLNQPVDGVPLQSAQAFQANLKPQIIALMRQKFPELKTDDEAWAKAQSDVGVLDVGREWAAKALGFAQQFGLPMKQGAAGMDQNYVDQFLNHVMPGASDADKHAYLTKLYAMPPDQRNIEIASKLPSPLEGVATGTPRNTLLPYAEQVSTALTHLADPDFQKHKADEIAQYKADMQRNVSDDPRLKGTFMERIASDTAQLPSAIAAFANPVLWPMALAQVADQAREGFRALHPEWDSKTLEENTARATMVQFFGQQAANFLFMHGAGALMEAIQSPAKRAISQALINTAGQSAIAAGTQAGTNIVTGEPTGKGVGEAAITGGIQGFVGGVAHGAGELVGRGAPVTERPPVTEERPPVAEQPPPVTEPVRPPVEPVRPAEEAAPLPTEQPAVPVTQEDVARRAYELYDERTKNGQPGTAHDDWTQAQKELSQTSEPTPVTQGESEPWVSAIANRYTAERVASGELGEVAPGQGFSTQDLLAKGLQMGPEQINQHVSDLMNGRGGNVVLQGAAVRAEEARLSQRSNAASRASEAAPANQQLRVDADNAFKDLTDFHNGPVAKFKKDWSDQGRTLQGELPVDLSTFNGMREAFLKDVGKPPSDSMEPALRSAAKKVSAAAAAEKAAMQKLSNEIGKQTANKQLSSAEAVRNSIRERMGLGPCST
jgi:hypothetical protein